MLTIGLDHTKKEPLYRQIYAYIRDEIRSGALPCGSKLPSTRRLAKHMDLSRNTIDLAYGQLTAEGYIEAQPKRGYFVCQVEDLAAFHIPVEAEDEEPVLQEEPAPYDFSPVGVDMSLFPYNVWRKLLKEVMMDDNSELFQKGENQGDMELRRAIMYYLRQSRGVHVAASQIVIGAGIENLLFLLRLTLGKDQVMAMENPAYLNAYRTIRELGFQVLPVNMDEEGLEISELERSSADLAYVTPAHQYPTGVVLPIGRRSRLIKWAREKEGRYVIEDDYDSEFRYYGKPIPALQGIDESGRVIYLGTFSKAIAPAIRIGYMVLPKSLVAAYKKTAGNFSCAVSRIDQRVLTFFLSEGHFERHQNRMRNVYKEKHDLLIQKLKEIDSSITVYGAGAGLHVRVDFHIKDTEWFEQELLNRGVRIYPLSLYYIEGCPEREQYILGFTKMQKEDMIKGLNTIREVYGLAKDRLVCEMTKK